jgi:exopolysaccharide production protein ExoQ
MIQKSKQSLSDFLIIFSLFFLSNATAFVYVLWLSPEIVVFEFVLWLVLTAITIWVMKNENIIPKFFDNLKKNWVVLPFFIYSGISIFWSVYWEISVYRWLILLFTIITGAYIGLRYDIKGIIKSLSIFGIYILFLSSMLVFFVPNIGVMNYHSIQGAWKGVYWHKGHMGLIATFINILFLINIIISLQSKGKHILFWGLLYIYSLLFVYKTDSVAGYITTIFLHGVILLSLILMKFRGKIRGLHYLFFFLAVIFASLILFINLEHFFGLFNRNTSLTGRIPMWAFLFETYFSKRPFLGYGFNAFWYIDSHRVTLQHATGYPDPIVIADNGFIDILVNTGFVGIILFSIFYLGAWWHAVRYTLAAKDINEVFPIILMSYTLIANISWSLIFENEGFFMLIMIAVLFSISSGVSTNREG